MEAPAPLRRRRQDESLTGRYAGRLEIGSANWYPNNSYKTAELINASTGRPFAVPALRVSDGRMFEAALV